MGGESGDVGVVLAGAEVVFFNLGIEVLAGEHKGIIERSAGFYCLAKRLVGVVLLDEAGSIDYLPDGAEAVVEVEVLKVLLFALVDIVLCQYLPVGPPKRWRICDVDIFLFQRAKYH